MASGYIAGGTIAGVVGAFLQFSDSIPAALDLQRYLPVLKDGASGIACVALTLICLLLFFVGIGKLFPDPTATGKKTNEN